MFNSKLFSSIFSICICLLLVSTISAQVVPVQIFNKLPCNVQVFAYRDGPFQSTPVGTGLYLAPLAQAALSVDISQTSYPNPNWVPGFYLDIWCQYANGQTCFTNANFQYPLETTQPIGIYYDSTNLNCYAQFKCLPPNC